MVRPAPTGIDSTPAAVASPTGLSGLALLLDRAAARSPVVALPGDALPVEAVAIGLGSPVTVSRRLPGRDRTAGRR